MATYEIDVTIDPTILTTVLQPGGYKFNIAKVMQDASGKVHNVVMSSYELGPNVKATWQESFTIYGSETEYEPNGSQIQASSDALAIQFQEKYVLPANLTNPTIETDTSIASTSFGFQNAGLISCVVTNNGAPFYISPTMLIPGEAKLTPKEVYIVWFDNANFQGAMISEDVGNSYTFDMTAETTQSVTYDKSGNWVPPTKKKPGKGDKPHHEKPGKGKGDKGGEEY
ncbi:hypothetical protein DFH27DRAFT_598994 [Peziza echinospora]|nr:hypothetical protein DFH27DRAFT_598994 [Peziza echinospora]